jgi:hypothetical protein
MMTRLTRLATLCVAVSGIGCGAADSATPVPACPSDNVCAIGSVRLMHVEGEWWAIVASDNTLFEVSGLPASYEQDGLGVYMRARELTGVISGHAVSSRIVEILEIRRWP